MVGHRGSSAGSYFADPTSPIPSHCASIVATSTLRVNSLFLTSLVFPHIAGEHVIKSSVVQCMVLPVCTASLDWGFVSKSRHDSCGARSI